jgi:FkbM family methyltransferase
MRKEFLKQVLQASLSSLGYKLDRIGLADREIGMGSCLRGLVARGFHPSFVLDIGAATGEWTRLALRYWPQASYFLMEPLEERRSRLVELSREHPNVRFILSAAGASSCELPIGIVPSDLDGSSFLYADISRLVPVKAIDDLLVSGEIEQPKFIKMDVQGYERNVLKGAEQTILNCPLILLESQFFPFEPSMWLVHDSIAWMRDRGFRPYEVVDVLRRPYDGAMGQCDLLFVRDNHWLVSNNSWR